MPIRLTEAQLASLTRPRPTGGVGARPAGVPPAPRAVAAVAALPCLPAGWDAGCVWSFVVRVPFDWGSSKNAMWGHGKGGRVFMRRAAAAARDHLQAECQAALRGGGIFPHHNRVWLAVLAVKPDHRGDAINLLDLAADGVKRAVGVDDRWFGVRLLDWAVAPGEAGCLVVGVCQADAWDAQVCSACGGVLPAAEFKRDRGRGGLGRGYRCRRCRLEG